MLPVMMVVSMAVLAGAQVPPHVLDMFENETLAVNETNETVVMILTPYVGDTSSPTTEAPTLATMAPTTMAPTTSAPSPAPAPKATIQVVLELASASGLDVSAFIEGLDLPDQAGTTHTVMYSVTVQITIDATGLTEADMLSIMADKMGVPAEDITITIGAARRLSDRRLAAQQVTAVASSDDPADIDAAKANADTITTDDLVTALTNLGYTGVEVTDLVPPAITAAVEIVTPVEEGTSSEQASAFIATQIAAVDPAAIGASSIGEPTAVVVEETQFPTPAPTLGENDTSAPTDADDEESGATLECAGFLTVAMVALSTVVSVQ